MQCSIVAIIKRISDNVIYSLRAYHTRTQYRRYVPDPKMDENGQYKSSIFG
jgi:hypothetical protein